MRKTIRLLIIASFLTFLSLFVLPLFTSGFTVQAVTCDESGNCPDQPGSNYCCESDTAVCNHVSPGSCLGGPGGLCVYGGAGGWTATHVDACACGCSSGSCNTCPTSTPAPTSTPTSTPVPGATNTPTSPPGATNTPTSPPAEEDCTWCTNPTYCTEVGCTPSSGGNCAVEGDVCCDCGGGGDDDVVEPTPTPACLEDDRVIFEPSPHDKGDTVMIRWRSNQGYSNVGIKVFKPDGTHAAVTSVGGVVCPLEPVGLGRKYQWCWTFPANQDGVYKVENYWKDGGFTVTGNCPISETCDNRDEMEFVPIAGGVKIKIGSQEGYPWLDLHKGGSQVTWDGLCSLTGYAYCWRYKDTSLGLGANTYRFLINDTTHYSGITNKNVNQTCKVGSYTAGGTVSGYVWEDTDGNGVTGSENRYTSSGITLTLRKGDGSFKTTQTNLADGSFSFTELDNGNYRLELPPPSQRGITKWRITIPGVTTNNVSPYTGSNPYYTTTVSGDWSGVVPNWPIKVTKGVLTSVWLGVSPGIIKGKVRLNTTNAKCTPASDEVGREVKIDRAGTSWTCTVTSDAGGNYTTWNAATETSNCPTTPRIPSNTSATYNLTVDNLNSGEKLVSGCAGNTVTLTIVDPIASGKHLTITTAVPGWYQAQGGDIHARLKIGSEIPTTDTNYSRDLDGFPGIVSYGTSALFGEGQVSSKGWLVKTGFTPSTNYNYFYQKLSSPEASWDGRASSFPSPSGWARGETKIIYASGDASLPNLKGGNGVSLGKKGIVFVGGDLNIDNKVEVDEGSFLAVIVRGNINIKGTLGNKSVTPNTFLEGVYFTDGVIDTSDDSSGNRLVAEGIFYASEGFNLQRDLKDSCGGGSICNATTPSELFLFRPDLVVNSPRELWTSSMSWLEVAP